MATPITGTCDPAFAAVRDALATFGLLPQWPELAGAA